MSAQRRRRLVVVGMLMGLPGVLVVLYTVSRLATLATISTASGHDVFWQMVSIMMIAVLVLGIVLLASGINVVQAALRGRLPEWPDISW
jgi:hypothetical protein